MLNELTVPFYLADGSLSFNSLLFEGNSTLAAYMRAWFVSFVVHLGPNGYSAYGPAAAPAWPRYGRDSKDTLIVPKQDIAITGDPDDSAQCKFFQMGRGNDQGI